MHVEAAELEADDEDAGVRIGFAELGCHAQGGKGGVAAHEAEGVAFDRFPQPEVAHEKVVGSWIHESGAGREDDMGDFVSRDCPGEAENSLPQRDSKTTGFRRVDSIARGSGGLALEIKGGVAEKSPDDGVPCFDPRSPESLGGESAKAGVGEAALKEGGEILLRMGVVRNDCLEAVEVGGQNAFRGAAEGIRDSLSIALATLRPRSEGWRVNSRSP